MSNAFNRYYESELNNLKGLAAEFAATHPALAPMLASPSGDPDVERLLEGVAFLTGLTRQKLDDEFPEFIQEIAQVLFPHYLLPCFYFRASAIKIIRGLSNSKGLIS